MLFQDAFLLANKNFPDGGTCLEFGVSIGNTYMWQAEQILTEFKNNKLIGFDSWEGLPEESKNVWYPDRHSIGAFAYPKELVEARLKVLLNDIPDERFQFVDGFFSESLTGELQKQIDDVIFINIDVDIHKSTIELLVFVKPFLRSGVIIYWDDWLDPQDVSEKHGSWGEHLAWEEWSKENPEIKTKTIKVNEWNQRIMEVL